MKQLIYYSRLLESGTDTVLRLLNEWKPRSFSLSEKDHEDDLFAWFKKNMPDLPVVAQYGIAKGKADLVLQDSHLIELKLAFNEQAVCEFDRCIGQLERYRQKWVEPEKGPVFLVLVGESDTEFRTLLHNWIERVNSSYFYCWFFLIEKRPSEERRGQLRSERDRFQTVGK